MDDSQEITTLRKRSAQAGAAADRARLAGSQEQQISAYCVAEALELRLDRLLTQQASSLPRPASATPIR